jgi:hypothetical protein
MGLSTYSKGEVIKHFLRTGSFTKPSALWVALYDSGDTELAAGNYARVQHGPGDSFWRDQVGGNGLSSNIGAVTFPEPSGANWGTAASFKVFDASTGGNEMGSGVLSSAKTINVGDPAPNFPDGAIVIAVA